MVSSSTLEPGEDDGRSRTTSTTFSVASFRDVSYQDVHIVTTSDLSLSHSQVVQECYRNKTTMLKTLFCGQVLSFMLCSIGTTSTALSRWYGIYVPCFQGLLMYFMLACTFGVKQAYEHTKFVTILKNRGWKYMLLGIIDVEANFLLIKAYTFTTLTSAQLCDSFTIPTVLVLSYIFLRVRYKVLHYIGVALCLAGSICLVFSDERESGKNAKNEVLGDIFAFGGAFLYGCSNVAQEFIVKNYNKTEYLGMLGITGSIVAAIQVMVFERQAIADISWCFHVALLMVAFAVCQYCYYALMPVVMTLSSATVVNLSLLTSDLYTLLFGLLLFSYKFSYLYFIAFGGILIGLVLYNLTPTPVSPKKVKQTMKKVKAKKEEANVFDAAEELHPKIKDASKETAKETDSIVLSITHKKYVENGNAEETFNYIRL